MSEGVGRAETGPRRAAACDRAARRSALPWRSVPRAAASDVPATAYVRLSGYPAPGHVHVRICLRICPDLSGLVY